MQHIKKRGLLRRPVAVTSCSNGVCGWVAHKCSVFSGHPDNTPWVPCDSHAGGEGEAAVSRHRGQGGSEESDHAGGRHVRIHCSCSANIHQRNHFPGGEGEPLDCILALTGVAGVCLCPKEEVQQLLQVHGALAIDLSQAKLLS